MAKRLINVKFQIKNIQNSCKYEKEIVSLHRVFHGIRLLRLIKIGCRETINFFLSTVLSTS